MNSVLTESARRPVARKTRRMPATIVGAAILFALAVTGVLVLNSFYPRPFSLAAGAFIVVWTIAGGIVGFGIDKDASQAENRELQLENAEEQYQSAPHDEKLARFVFVARRQIEVYVSQNQFQQRLIYWLTVLIMLIGFVLIGIGVALSIGDQLQPALLAASSGIVVNFIGGTFMLIYRSTMSQSKEYVDVLERINAVEMAIQILEKIEGGSDLRDQTRAKISLALLDLYAAGASKKRGVKNNAGRASE